MSKTSRWALGISVSLLTSVALPAGVVAADEEAPKEKREETVTVYGTSNPIPVFEYPGQVSVVTRDDIDLFMPTSPSEMLRDVPGVEFSGGPRRTGEMPAIRGFSSENVLILVDGARQSFISAHDGRFFLDPEILKSAEVVRGPSSALYGSGAVGGVMAFETVDAINLLQEGETYGGRVRAGFNSASDDVFGTLTLFGAKDGWDGLVSLGLRQSGDIKLGSGADLPADDEIETGLAKLGYQFTDALKGEVSWQKFKNSAFEPNNGQGTLGTGDAVLDRNVDKDIESEIFRLGLEFNPISKLLNTHFTAYQSNTNVDEFDATIPRTTIREIETSGFSLRNASVFDIGRNQLTFTIGGDYYQDEQKGVDTDTTTGVRGGVPNGKSEFTGLFAQLETEIEKPFGAPGSLIIIPGIRYDEFTSSSDLSTSESSDNKISSRFAIGYGPTDWFRVFANWSEAFRAPSINELYLDGVHFSVPHPILFNPAAGQMVFVSNNFVPNADLKPETSETVEVGFGVDFHDLFRKEDRLQAKISWYESEVEDLINIGVNFNYDATCFIGPGYFPCTAGTTYSDNVDSADLSGMEAELVYDADRLFANVSYSSIEGTDNLTGEDVGVLTPDRWAINLGVKVPEWNARFGGRIQIATDYTRKTSDGAGGFTVSEQRDGYTVLDLYSSWSPQFAESLRFDFGVDNVFDEDYDRVFEGVSEPGRAYKIAATWQFGM